MSRGEAMRVAQLNAEWGVAGCLFVIIVLIFLAILMIYQGEYLLALIPLALIPLAIYCMWRAHRFSKIYAHEREKAAADRG